MRSSLTAGSIRTLDLALRLALERGESAVESQHVLWAFILQETRAAEILSRQGLTAEILASLFAPPPEGWDPNLIAAVGAAHVDSVAGLPAEVSRQPLVVAMLQHVRDQLMTEVHHAEIGTEHLLYGLLAVDPALAIELKRYGLNLEQMQRTVAGYEVAAQTADGGITLRFREGHESDDHDTLRILDAAANRAREGLRVLEDYVRFVLDDGHLSGRLKRWRHGLAVALQPLVPQRLLAARETEQDVGTQIRTLTETRRDSLLAVVQANFKRVEEAARTLEEFSKVLSPDLGQQIERLRYEIYTLEKATLQTQHSRDRLAQRSLYMLLTEDQCHHGSGPAVRGALAGGVGIVQLREKKLNDREIVARGRRVREWTRETGALFIMNDRPDLAVLTDADGVHVGQEELTVKDARRIVGPDKLVGVSTHSIEQARQAVLDGADYIGVGPVFPSKTKQFSEFAGLEFVRQVAAEITLPAYAIGGITLENLPSVLAAGAKRVAISSALCGAAHPADVARQFKDELDVRQTSAVQIEEDSQD